MNIQKIINDEIEKNNEKQKVNSWRASGLGSCLTGRYLERAGVKADSEFDERTLRVFAVGKMFEEWMLGLIAVDHDFTTQTEVASKEHDFTGHFDLRMEDEEGEDVVWEIKTKHSRAFWYMTKEGKAQRQHEMQLWSYLWLTGVEKGRILYISKDDLAIQEYFIFRNNKELEAEVMAELDILNDSWKKKLPPRPIDDPKHWHNKYCRWHKQCTTQDKYSN